jgi:hypothetical protein
VVAGIGEVEHRFLRALPVHEEDSPPEVREPVPPSADRWWHAPWLPTAIRIGAELGVPAA